MHKALLDDNPVRKLRQQLGMSLNEMAEESGLNRFGLLRVESGMYAAIPPRVEDFLKKKHPSLDLNILGIEYKTFQQNYRKKMFEGQRLVLPKPNLSKNPVTLFREYLEYGTTEFMKKLCVNPGVMYKVEGDMTASMPEQLREALSQAGMSEDELDELGFRISERYEQQRRITESKTKS